jgi:NhaA family Na+:H+ antiporter
MVFDRRHPAVPFLLLLAIADDAMGLIILAVFYPTGELAPGAFAIWMAAAFGLSWTMRQKRVLSFWPYVLVGGALSWAALFIGGLHPALALVPIIPFMPHAHMDLGPYAKAEEFRGDTLNRFEHAWKVPVQVILFFFGLVNAGVSFSSIGVGTWIVLVALLAGKPLGIVGFTYISVALGLRRAEGLDGRSLLVLGMAAAIGFTVSLFFSTASFPQGGPALDQAKMGALFSFSAAILTVGLGKVLRAGESRP